MLTRTLAFSMGTIQAGGVVSDYNGSFNGGGPVDHSVSEVVNNPVPSRMVELNGTLVGEPYGCGYMFDDGTGRILTNIPYEAMAGQPVMLNQPVRIQGAVRYDMMGAPCVDAYVVDPR